MATLEAIQSVLTFVSPERVEYKELSPSRGQLIVEPLEPGYATTLGNSLRRVLLSSLEGYGIVYLQIEGVEHEYSTIPGVYEDCTEIVLNLKQVRFKCTKDKPIDFARIDVNISGQSVFKAQDIERFTNDFTIVNGDLVICHMEPSVNLRMTLYVQRGRSYLPLEEFQEQNLEVGVIPIDAIFTPIKRVAFKVENVRVGKKTDYERLILDVTTDGTITPSEAILKAINILINQLVKLKSFAGETTAAEIMEESAPQLSKTITTYTTPSPPQQISEKVLKMSIEDLKIPQRALRALRNENINTVGDLLKLSEKDILKLRGVGKKAVEEIRSALLRLGISNWGNPEEQ